MTLAIVLLVAGLIVGGGIGYFAAPTKEVVVQGSGTTVIQTVKEAPLKGKTVRIGWIASDTTGLETGKPYREQIIQPDMNAWLGKLGYDTKIQYLIDNANEQANIHLEKIQGFRSTGVTITEAGGWSGHAQACLSYVNSNGMLMWSWSSTSPTLAIANDNLFRMCTADSHLAPAMADVMWDFGVKDLIIIQRADSWGDGIVNLLKPAWTAKGGTFVGDVVRYAGESTEFTNYLSVADGYVATALAKHNGVKERVGVIILAFNEAAVMVKQAASYPNIYNVHWWGSDGTAKSQRMMDDSPEESNHIGVYSFYSRETTTPLYYDLEERYTALTNQAYGSYSAYSFDIAQVMVQSFTAAQSDEGQTLVPLQKIYADQLYGAAGWAALDEFGDRAAPPYDVWGFYPGEMDTPPQAGRPSVSIIMAQYDPVFRKSTFVTGILGYTPPGP